MKQIVASRSRRPLRLISRVVNGRIGGRLIWDVHERIIDIPDLRREPGPPFVVGEMVAEPGYLFS